MVDAAGTGLPDGDCAALAGIHYNTLTDWRARGHLDHEAGVDTIYRALWVDLERVKSRAIRESLERLRAAAVGGQVVERHAVKRVLPDGSVIQETRAITGRPSESADKWLLERLRKKDFALSQKVEMTGQDGGPIQQQVKMVRVDLSHLTDEQLKLITDLAQRTVG